MTLFLWQHYLCSMCDFFFKKKMMNHHTYLQQLILTGNRCLNCSHFIRYTTLIRGRTHFCLENCFDSSLYGLSEAMETLLRDFVPAWHGPYWNFYVSPNLDPTIQFHSRNQDWSDQAIVASFLVLVTGVAPGVLIFCCCSPSALRFITSDSLDCLHITSEQSGSSTVNFANNDAVSSAYLIQGYEGAGACPVVVAEADPGQVVSLSQG